MPDVADAPAAAVTVWTLWHGVEIAGTGSVELRGDALRIGLADASAELTITLAELDGIRTAGGRVTLYATSGDLVELRGGAALEALAVAMRARACTVPELTLPLRGLGSVRTYRGPEHDRFFAPLLAARRRAQEAGDPASRLSAIDGRALYAELVRVLHALAAERFPASPPERRALEAELDDLAAPILRQAERVDERARRVAPTADGTGGSNVGARGGDDDPWAHADLVARLDDDAFVRWRAWTLACRALYAEADRCWLAVAPILAGTPVPGSPSPSAPRRRGWSWGRGTRS